MQVGKATIGAISKGGSFVRRQPRDWKVTATRTSVERFVYQMVLPYLSIYTVALGATATELGIVNSVGLGIAGLLGPFTGWFIDRIGIKSIYLVGIVLLAISYLVYGVAQSWSIIIIAMLAYWLGFSTSTLLGCATVCRNSLATADRATAMSCCESFAGGLLGMVSPMLGALLVTTFGGVNVSGIRPLFFIGLAFTIGTFLLILTQLSNRRWRSPEGSSLNFFRDLAQIFKQGRNLKRWLIIHSINSLPVGMIIPFSQLFAHEVKGADQYILGAMVTGMALTPLVLGIPLGRLADRIGRKRVLYLAIPVFCASNLMLIWAPSPHFLIVAGVLQGFFSVCKIITVAMTFELVPPEQIGRWLGITRFFGQWVSAISAFIAGVIWDSIGAQYVFLIVVGLDLFIRIPLLIGMPETLSLRTETEQRE